MKNIWMKTLLLLLALVMTVSMVACNGGEEAPEGSDTEAVGGDVSESQSSSATETEKSAWNDSGLDDRNYEGETFVIRYATETTFIPDTMNVSSLEAGKDIVKKAGYVRDKAFEEKTKTEISYVTSKTNPNVFYGSSSEIVAIRSMNLSGDLAEIDMLCVGARTSGIMISESLFTNLNDYDNYIHADSYYYSTGLNSQMALGGKVFAVSGYHTTLNYRYMNTIAVNNDVLSAEFPNEEKIDELYELAINRQWTLETMLNYGKNYATGPVHNNLEQDRYTLIASENDIQSFFHALGGTVVEKDQNDLPVLSIEKAFNVELLEKLYMDLGNNSSVYVAPNNTQLETFMLGNSLFLQCAMSAVSGIYDQNGIDARLMPMPLNEEGTEYCTNCDAWCTNLVGIPASVSDPDMAAYCFEAFMALSYDYVYPEFYEKLFKDRYAENSAESQIFDIITENSYIDYVNVYQWQAKNDAIRKIIVSTSNTVSSAVTAIADEVSANIKTFLETYDFG